MSKNPIAELARTVAQSIDLDAAVDLFERHLAESGCSTAEIEKTPDILRRAFRAYATSRGIDPPSRFCSFCKKTQDEIASLVVASDVAICDECAALAIAVIEGRAARTDGPSRLRAVLRFVSGGRR